MAKILVIDDEAGIRESFTKILTRFGHSVVTAANGREGVDIHRETPVDIVITDIFMPEQEGIETIIELRRDFPDVKIIAVSGGGCRGSRDYLPVARGLGADIVLSKPVSAGELQNVVKKALEGRG